MNALDKWAFSLICDVYNPAQPRYEKGRWTKKPLSSKIKAIKKISTKKGSKRVIHTDEEERAVSSEILTWHPEYKPGETRTHRWRGLFYAFDVNGPGNYDFAHRIPIVGNEDLIAEMEERKGGKK